MRGQRHVPAALYPRQSPCTHSTGGRVGHRTSLDRCGKSHPPPGLDPRTVQPLAQSLYRLSYPAQRVCRYIPVTCWTQTFTCIFAVTLKDRSIVSCHWKWTDTSAAHSGVCLSVQPLAAASGLLKGYDNLWSDVSLSVFIRMEDILSICFELWLDKQ
jgi:hypothetical protein